LHVRHSNVNSHRAREDLPPPTGIGARPAAFACPRELRSLRGQA